VRKSILSFLFLAICPLLFAQQTLNNDSVIKLVKAGLSDDLIVSTINGSPGAYDISADGIIALKTAGASEKVIAAVVAKTNAAAQPAMAPIPPPPTTAARPQIRLSLCEFEVNGTTASGNNGAIIGGLAGAVIAGSHRHAYYVDINQEVQHAYETAFMESGSIQYVKSEKPADSAGGTPPVSTDTAVKNQPYACVSANPYWAAKMGFNKQIAIITTWKVENPNGCKLKFKTDVSSKQTYGKFPTGANPVLKSAYLELSKDDAREFLVAYRGAMKKAGCGE
jgi:hypothetical protein